jgi:hypothetical protein
MVAEEHRRPKERKAATPLTSSPASPVGSGYVTPQQSNSSGLRLREIRWMMKA